MRSNIIAFAAALLALPACATVPPTGDAVESITYETGPCFGACPIYKVTVRSDGSGLFEGRRFTAVTGQRAFRVTSDQFRAFAEQLEPLRPESGIVRYSGEPLCRGMATDLPSADVKWRTAGGDEQELYFYFGCDMETKRAIADRIGSAPDLLPIRDLVRAGR